MLVKAFDYTRPTDKETMANSMRTLASGSRHDAYLQFCQAYWFQLFGYATEAKIAYSKALQLDPAQPDALFELGRIYMLEFQNEKAATLWLRLMQEAPDFPPLVRWLRASSTAATAPPALLPPPAASSAPAGGPAAAALPSVPVRDDVQGLRSTLLAMRAGAAVPVSTAAPSPPASTPATPAPAPAAAAAAAAPR